MSSSEISSTVTFDGLDAEQQPLLPRQQRPTPLPKLQLLVVCFARLSEPIAYSLIFPFINEMVEELHFAKKPADVGFYSGLVDSLFAMTQLCTVFHWGCLSDRIGRKPVVVVGLSGVALASLCFGLSTSFWQLLVSRAIAGALSGNAAVIQSIIGDITDESNQGQAFPLTSVTWCIGIVVGPLIGGTLSHPAERYPALLGNIQLLRDRPFFLPCFTSAAITVVAILSSILFLEESLPSKVRAKKLSRDGDAIAPKGTMSKSYATVASGSEVCNTIPQHVGSGRLLADPRIQRVLLAGFSLSFTAIAYETVFVLWAYSPLSLGGLERKPAEIGYALASTGILGIGLTVFLYPRLNRRFGALPIFGWVMSLFPIIFILIPLLSVIARLMGVLPSDNMDAEEPTALGALWVGVGLILMIGRAASMAFPAYLLVVRMVAPGPESLGSMFGLAQSVACIGEATGPAFVSSLFALSANRQILHGNFVWLVMLGISLSGAWVTISLRKLV